MDVDDLEFDPEGNWPGKTVDWDSKLVEAQLHVELPFWIAAPDGLVTISIGDCSIPIRFRNCVVGLYRNGAFYRSESNLFHLTVEHAPISDEQKNEIDEQEGLAMRHYRTLVSLPVKCHECLFEMLESTSRRKKRDARMYIQSLSHAAIRFVNQFITAYRAASYDPFVTHVSYWDLPVWHLSNADNRIWTVPMAFYPVSDQLPAVSPDGRFVHRTTVGRIRDAALNPLSVSLEELLDAWTCFYRGQYAEAIRKAVTAVEVCISDLLANLPAFRQNRTEDDVEQHLAKMKFNEQLSWYLRATKRKLPGPLTHMSPEVNRVRLDEELDHARERRHKIVHESEKVDYEHDGPLLRIMETMSWLHGWLREDNGRSDPTSSRQFAANKAMRDVFPLEPLIDRDGIQIIKPRDGGSKLVNQVHVEQLQRASSVSDLDIEFCVAWMFEKLLHPIADGRYSPSNTSPRERYWIPDQGVLRPIFILDIKGCLEIQDVESIACRFAVLKLRNSKTERPLIVVNHLRSIDHKHRSAIPCVDGEARSLVEDLGFTVISLTDWVAIASLLSQTAARDFGSLRTLRTIGLVSDISDQLERVGYVRRVLPGIEVVSIVLESGFLNVGDEICIRSGDDCFSATIESQEINRQPFTTAYAVCVLGVKLDTGVVAVKNEAIIYRVRRPLIPFDSRVKPTFQLKKRDYRDLLRMMASGPVSVVGHGVYGGDHDLGG